MALFRRSPKPSPALRRKHEEIARQEAELRERLEKLEQLVAKVPLIEKNRAEQRSKYNQSDRRFRVSVAAQDRASLGESRSRRPRSLRKERREGQIIFLLLVVALAVAVIWLISNLHS
ncbi:MAG: hypothetical protein J2P56_07780 [Verrucomicrobia bacterium]|nr:hypothetical protein [Verrucomicrobiota bacterium]